MSSKTLCPNAIHAYSHDPSHSLSIRQSCLASLVVPPIFANARENHIIPFPLSTSTVTIAPTTTTRKIIQNAQHMYVRCLLFLCCDSSQLSLCDGSAVMVVQKRKLLRGLPLRLRPKDNRELFPFRVKRREPRLDREPEASRSGGKCADLGVGGSEGGCEESAKRKREARREARLEGGVSAARAKCAERGVEGREGAGFDCAVAN